MTTYNTGNPVGSATVKDLYDNAENLDVAINSQTAGEWTDRLGNARKTWKGVEDRAAIDIAASASAAAASASAAAASASAAAASASVAAAGYRDETLVARDDAQAAANAIGPIKFFDTKAQADAVVGTMVNGDIIEVSQDETRAGARTRYKVQAGALVFVVKLDQVRHDLANAADPAKGAGMVGYLPSGVGAVGRNVQSKLREVVSVKDFGAVGDGTTDDTAKFTALEAVYTGIDVNLGGATYSVTALPARNNYVNGRFKFAGATRPADPGFDVFAPRFHPFGGQLVKLRDALMDPLQQIVGICFIGDSITWGQTLPENSPTDPRNSTLSDPRNNFAAPCWVNEFKRYIGSAYAFGAAPVLSNWAASSSGEAIAEYSITRVLYPRERQFTLVSTGPSLNSSEVAASGIPSGFQFRLADGNLAGTSFHELSFNFTGTEFTLIYACVDLDYSNYELFVDGVSQGVFTTSSAGGAVSNTSNNRRLHTFPYVRNKTIVIKTVRPAQAGVRVLRLEGIEVTKKIRITNQGINGTTTRTYDLYNLSGSFSAPTAVTAQDNFIFMQLGTNDRARRNDVPAGVQGFQRFLTPILNRITPLGDVIVMVSNRVRNESPATYSFTMQDTRDVLMREARFRNLDFIDNYSIFARMDDFWFTADGLHPNAFGHQRMAKNITGALESA